MGPLRPLTAGVRSVPDGSLDHRLVEMLLSRVCHDLAGPVGAIGNGIELLEELGTDPEAVDIVADSARRAARRLQLFRLAYGRAGQSPTRGLAEVRDAMTAWLDGSRVELKWPDPSAPTDCPRGVAKLVLNTLMLGEECLPRGGTLLVRLIGLAEGGSVSVVGTGPSVRLEAELLSGLAGRLPPEEVGPRSLQAVLVQRFADAYGFRVTVLRAEPAMFEFDLRL